MKYLSFISVLHDCNNGEEGYFQNCRLKLQYFGLYLCKYNANLREREFELIQMYNQYKKSPVTKLKQNLEPTLARRSSVKAINAADRLE